MIYGTNNAHTVRDSTDLIGIRTLILRQYWQAVATNPSQADLDAMRPAPPAVPGGLLYMGEQTMKERGRYASLWTFQGVNGDGKSVTFKRRGQSYDYGFDPGFSQVPIQVHADFDALREKYQGYPGNDGTTVIWPAELAEPEGSGGSALSKSGGDGAKLNPMYGIQSFFEMDGVYRYRYAETQLPAGLLKGVGRIAGTLPGNPPALTNGRNWLKAPTSYQRKGLVYDITEYYWLSRRGGWPAPVYSGSTSSGKDSDDTLGGQRVADGAGAAIFERNSMGGFI